MGFRFILGVWAADCFFHVKLLMRDAARQFPGVLFSLYLNVPSGNESHVCYVKALFVLHVVVCRCNESPYVCTVLFSMIVSVT
jgi:hypothetical protein